MKMKMKMRKIVKNYINKCMLEQDPKALLFAYKMNRIGNSVVDLINFFESQSRLDPFNDWKVKEDATVTFCLPNKVGIYSPDLVDFSHSGYLGGPAGWFAVAMGAKHTEVKNHNGFGDPIDGQTKVDDFLGVPLHIWAGNNPKLWKSGEGSMIWEGHGWEEQHYGGAFYARYLSYQLSSTADRIIEADHSTIDWSTT